MPEDKRPHTTRRYFTQSFCLESLIKYDRDMLLHGEQRSWWDRRHHYPKEISIYQHGTLIRTVTWYINGNVKKTINTYRDMKEICEYYPNGSIKYRQNYKLGEMGFMRHGEWSGFYRNGNKHYVESYAKGVLKNRVRYISNGRPLSGYNSGSGNILDHSVEQDSDKVIETKIQEIPNSDSTVKDVSTPWYSDYFKKLLGNFIKF